MSRERQLAHRQRGVATVFIAMVLLLAMGLIAIYTSRSAIVEQRISANEVRAKQALAAATAGIDNLLAHVRSGGIDHDEDGTVDRFDAVALVSGGKTSTYSVRFAVAAPGNLPVCPDTPAAVNLNGAAEPDATSETLLAVSCGWSDDSASVQRVMQLFERRPPFSGPPATPLVTKGGIGLSGNPAVYNYFNDLTVWSGETLDKNGSPSSTFIRNIGDPDHAEVDLTHPYREVGGAGAPDGYVESSTNHANDLTLGHDMVGDDTTLSDKSPAQFFELFMGMPPAAYRSTMPDHVVNQAGYDAIASKNGKVIWVDGNLTSLKGIVGTPDEPVVLIVGGNLETAGNTTVNGFVFVMGSVEKINGTVTIYGGLVTAGTFNGGGTPSIVYDPFVLGKAQETLGSANKVAGTWRDW